MNFKDKQSLLLGFIAITQKFNDIVKLEEYLKTFINITASHIEVDTDSFYNSPNFTSDDPKMDSDWIYNQMEHNVEIGSYIKYRNKEYILREGRVLDFYGDEVLIRPYDNPEMDQELINVSDIL